MVIDYDGLGSKTQVRNYWVEDWWKWRKVPSYLNGKVSIRKRANSDCPAVVRLECRMQLRRICHTHQNRKRLLYHSFAYLLFDKHLICATCTPVLLHSQ